MGCTIFLCWWASHLKLGLPGIDRLWEFILQHCTKCLLYKKDLQCTYRQLTIDPRDYHDLAWYWNWPKHLLSWQAFTQIVSLKSLVSTHVKPGRIFMLWLLHSLIAPFLLLPFQDYLSGSEADIDWWLTLLPLFNGVSLIKLDLWSFHNLFFTTQSLAS